MRAFVTRILTTKSNLILENSSLIPNRVPNLKIIAFESCRYSSACTLDEAYSERGLIVDVSSSKPSCAPYTEQVDKNTIRFLKF